VAFFSERAAQWIFNDFPVMYQDVGARLTKTISIIIVTMSLIPLVRFSVSTCDSSAARSHPDASACCLLIWPSESKLYSVSVNLWQGGEAERLLDENWSGAQVVKCKSEFLPQINIAESKILNLAKNPWPAKVGRCFFFFGSSWHT